MAKEAKAKAVLTLNDSAFVRGMKRAQEMAKALAAQFKNNPIKTTFLAAALGAEKAAGAVGRLIMAGVKFASVATGIGLGVLAVDALANSFRNLIAGVISGAARMESFRATFTTLMGSSQKAAAHISELNKFSDKTPFKLTDMIPASKALNIMTEGLLDNAKGWTLVGDAAAGTGREFGDMGQTVGRLFAELRSGAAVGDTLRSLQDMGAITFDAARRISAIAEVNPSKAWEMAEKALGRFSGEMERRSHTWEGLMSTFENAVDKAMAAFGTPLIEALKPTVEFATEHISSWIPMAEEFGKKFSYGVQVGVGAVESLFAQSGQFTTLFKDTMTAGGLTFVDVVEDGLLKFFTGAMKTAIRYGLDPSAPFVDAYNAATGKSAGKEDRFAQVKKDVEALASLARSNTGGASVSSGPTSSHSGTPAGVMSKEERAAAIAKVMGVAKPLAAGAAYMENFFSQGMRGTPLLESPFGDHNYGLGNRATRTVNSLVPLRERRRATQEARAFEMAKRFMSTGSFTGPMDASNAVHRGDTKLAKQMVAEQQKGGLGADVASIKQLITQAWFTGGGGQ